jgi:hypothetical protein
MPSSLARLSCVLPQAYGDPLTIGSWPLWRRASFPSLSFRSPFWLRPRSRPARLLESSAPEPKATAAMVVPRSRRSLDHPSLAFDSSGNLYLATLDNRIRRIDRGGIVTTFAGTGDLIPTVNGAPANQRGSGTYGDFLRARCGHSRRAHRPSRKGPHSHRSHHGMECRNQCERPLQWTCSGISWSLSSELHRTRERSPGALDPTLTIGEAISNRVMLEVR